MDNELYYIEALAREYAERSADADAEHYGVN